MTVRAHADLKEFWELTRALYEADPVRHNFTITALAAFLDQGGKPFRFLSVWSEGKVVGSLLQMVKADSLRLCVLPVEQVAAVAQALAETGVAVPSVNGPDALVSAFVSAWGPQSAKTAGAAVHEMLHELDGLTLPVVSGAARLATEADLDLLVPWTLRYEEEAHDKQSAEGGMRISLRSTILGPNMVFLIWEDSAEDGGRPTAVAHAGVCRPVAGVARVGPVFVPKELRGRGYGIAVAGAATAWALQEAGAERVVLFTDLSNPTSNSIYRKLGYRPIEPFTTIKFDG